MMKDIGPVKTWLGIEFKQNLQKHQFYISQGNYINNILRRFGMMECKPALTPIESNSVLQRPVDADE